ATPVRTPVLGDNAPTPGSLDPSSVTVTVPSVDGSTSLAPATGSLTLPPPAGVTGTTTYTYQVCLAAPHGTVCDTAVVTVVVDPIPAIDAADHHAGTTPEATPVTTPVLGNDVPTHGSLDPSSVTVTVPSVDGSTSVDPATGSITFTPNAGFTATTTYTYQVCLPAPHGAVCDTAVVTVVVTAPVIEALDDDSEPVQAGSGGNTPSVLGNDTLGGKPMQPGQITLVPGIPSHPGLEMN